MWRRVSCEHPLDTSQSILRLRGGLIKLSGFFLNVKKRYACKTPKGNLVHIPEPGSGTVRISLSVVATRHDQETPSVALGRVVFSA